MDKLFDAVVAFNAAAHVKTVHALAKLADLQLADLSLRLQIILVAHYNDILDRELAVEVVLVNPLVQVIEATWVGNVEHQDAAVGASIVAGRQSAKPLLPRRVPKLQTHAQIFASMQKSLRLAVHSNRRLCVLTGERLAFTNAH